MRLGRAYAPDNNTESCEEQALESALTRRVCVDRMALRGGGWAGDSTGSRGTPTRVEDAWSFFGKHVDSPTFVRYAAALGGGGGGSAAASRTRASKRAATAGKRREAAEVAALGLWEAEKFGQ